MLDTQHVSSDLRRLSPNVIVGLVLLVATAVILAALAFEHIGGYRPCPLCLQQRYAYYLGIPALGATLALLRMARSKAAAAVLLAVGIAFLVNAGLGVYQAGAEWRLWEPPAACATPAELPTFDVESLKVDRMPAGCGVASWRFLGLSFAGWNALVSAALAAGAVWASLKALGRFGWQPQGSPG